jgi:SAM-dependent methyltransferase
MLTRHPDFRPHTVCEIGCGAGGILAELQKALPADVQLTGYEISSQAHSLSAQFANTRCRYILGDAFTNDTAYDLVLVMDVIEHVEDCFAFLRAAKRKGNLKLYHIPLDTSFNDVLRGTNRWDSLGHLHLFTMETALKSVEYTGHRVIDWMLTPAFLSQPPRTMRNRLALPVRSLLRKVSASLGARAIGGYSILILAE